MPDIYCEWGQDILVTPNGSIQTAVGWDRVRQRIIRSLITNPAQTLPDGSTTAPDYVWHKDFGVGAGSMVGQVPNQHYQAHLISMINQAVLSDVSVDPGSTPTVIFQQLQPGTWIVFISVTLKDGTTGRVSVKVGA